eukprot:245698-Amphidinium_carterae.1
MVQTSLGIQNMFLWFGDFRLLGKVLQTTRHIMFRITRLARVLSPPFFALVLLVLDIFTSFRSVPAVDTSELPLSSG